MFERLMRRGGFAGVAILSLGAGAAQAATTTLEISITNHQSDGGVFLTPLYVAFHDGAFDPFDAGQPASMGLELLAEEGMFGPGVPGSIANERLAVSPGSQGAAVTGPSGFGSQAGQPPVIDPGETASTTVDVNGSLNRYFTYLSMVIPSNDTFIGNDIAQELFDTSGSFLGDQTIQVFNSDTWDAGTEVNNGAGAAFATSSTVGGPSSDQNGVVTTAGDLTFLTQLGFSTAAGTQVTNVGGANSLLATISIRQVGAQVPLPAGAPLFLSALGLLGFMRARRKAA